MGWFSKATGGVFDSKSGSPKQIADSPFQNKGKRYLQDQLEDVRDIPARQIAGMSDAERQQQAILGNVLSGSEFQDPNQSQYYRGLRDQMQQQTQQGLNSLRQRAQKAGMYASGSGLQQEANYLNSANANLNTLLGGLYNQERNRDNAYTRLAAASQYGSLPRQLEQAQLDAAYQQSLNPYAYGVPIAQSMMGHNASYYMTQPQGSDFNKYATIAGGLAGTGGLFV